MRLAIYLWLGCLVFASIDDAKAESIPECDLAAPHPKITVTVPPGQNGLMYSRQSLKFHIEMPDPSRQLSKLRIVVDGTLALEIGTQEIAGVTTGPIFDVSKEVGVGSAEAGQLPLDANATPNIVVYGYDTGTPQGCGHSEFSVKTADAGPFAIVVGFNYSGSMGLRWAQRDSREIVEYLISHVKVPPQNIYWLTDEADAASVFPANTVNIVVKPQSPTAISQAFYEIYRRADWGARLYFYFSGHEFARQDDLFLDGFYLLMWNSALSDPSTMYPRRYLYQQLLTNKHHLVTVSILDACYSGPADVVNKDEPPADPPAGKPKVIRAPYLDADPEENFMTEGIRISSSRGNKLSWEFEHLHHGVFTYNLLHAADGGGSVTVEDAFKLAKKQTEDYTPDPNDLPTDSKTRYYQDPQIYGFGQSGLESPWNVPSAVHP